MARSGPQAWLKRLDAWLVPFLAALPRAEQRRWAPLYVRGLLLPGERKSVEPIAARVCPGQVQQLHHFVSASPLGRLRRPRGVRFGCVLGDAEYGKVAPFRHALDAQGLLWALGIPPN